jgi:hypothetical protein
MSSPQTDSQRPKAWQLFLTSAEFRDSIPPLTQSTLAHVIFFLVNVNGEKPKDVDED